MAAETVVTVQGVKGSDTDSTWVDVNSNWQIQTLRGSHKYISAQVETVKRVKGFSRKYVNARIQTVQGVKGVHAIIAQQTLDTDSEPNR